MTRKPDTPPDEVPADLADLDDEALAALTAKLTADFDKLLDEGSRDVATMTAIADDITRVDTEVKARKAAEAEADAEIAKLAERVKATNPEPDPEPEPEPDPVPDPEVPAEPEATADPAPEPAAAPEKELVTAAATSRPALGDIARRVPRPRVEARRTPAVTITASSDLPGVRPDAEMTTLQLAEAMHDRARTLSDDGKRAPVASIAIPHTHWLGTDPTENARSIQDLVGEPNAAALVASGGWCAPSTPLFELFDLGPDTDDLFDLPGIGQQVRAGVMVPTFYGVGDVAGALWNWTEAQDIAAATQPAGPDKPCLKIPCPTWTESRLEAEGLCVTHGNLSDRAWPELTRQFLSTVMGAHQRRISAAKVAKVLAGATVVAPGAGMTPSDAAGDVLNVVSLAAADMRSQYRVSKSRSIDMLFPSWMVEVFRATLAMRAGVDLLSVTDADVVSYLTAKNVRPQFTPDWQPLYNAAPATAWPANVTFAAWFTGAYVSIDGGSIDLGVVRDSTLNSTNDFTAAWSEQFFQVVRRGPLARSYTVPLGVDGVTACCP